MLPQIKLALMFAKVAKQHGPKLLHANNADLLTKDLSDALVAQKNILTDQRKGAFMTAYDVLPVILEVKVLSIVVARKLDIDTSKSTIQILDEIVKNSESRGKERYAQGIKDTMEWTRALFNDPDIREVLKMEMPEIDRPGVSAQDAYKFFVQLAGRSTSELARVNEFLKHAKDVRVAPPPANDTAKPAAANDSAPAAKKPAAKKPATKKKTTKKTGKKKPKPPQAG